MTSIQIKGSHIRSFISDLIYDIRERKYISDEDLMNNQDIVNVFLESTEELFDNRLILTTNIGRALANAAPSSWVYPYLGTDGVHYLSVMDGVRPKQMKLDDVLKIPNFNVIDNRVVIKNIPTLLVAGQQIMIHVPSGNTQEITLAEFTCASVADYLGITEHQLEVAYQNRLAGARNPLNIIFSEGVGFDSITATLSSNENVVFINPKGSTNV